MAMVPPTQVKNGVKQAGCPHGDRQASQRDGGRGTHAGLRETILGGPFPTTETRIRRKETRQGRRLRHAPNAPVAGQRLQAILPFPEDATAPLLLLTFCRSALASVCPDPTHESGSPSDGGAPLTLSPRHLFKILLSPYLAKEVEGGAPPSASYILQTASMPTRTPPNWDMKDAGPYFTWHGGRGAGHWPINVR